MMENKAGHVSLEWQRGRDHCYLLTPRYFSSRNARNVRYFGSEYFQILKIVLQTHKVAILSHCLDLPCHLGLKQLPPLQGQFQKLMLREMSRRAGLTAGIG